jgi:hypothetical protein
VDELIYESGVDLLDADMSQHGLKTIKSTPKTCSILRFYYTKNSLAATSIEFMFVLCCIILVYAFRRCGHNTKIITNYYRVIISSHLCCFKIVYVFCASEGDAGAHFNVC